MELISREEAKNTIKNESFSVFDERILMNAIDSIPTIKERKEGEWEICIHPKDPPFSWWRCSECGMIIYSESETDRYEFHAYCGRCGARRKEKR